MSVTRRTFLRGAILGVGGAIATGALGDTTGRSVHVETHTLFLKYWKADGLKVAFFSDTHANDRDSSERAIRAAQMVVGWKPDICIFGGDAIDSDSPEAIESVERSFGPYESLKCPKVAVIGNHDYWSGALSDLQTILRRAGFYVLQNEIADFDTFHVAGYDDRIGGRHDDLFQPNRLGTISVMHEPDDVDIVPPTVSLQLSGHSHGGQICLPFGIPLHTPKGARRYTGGYYPDAKVPLYVSRGVGTTGFRWRLFCPPEVTLLTLRSAR